MGSYVTKNLGFQPNNIVPTPWATVGAIFRLLSLGVGKGGWGGGVYHLGGARSNMVLNLGELTPNLLYKNIVPKIVVFVQSIDKAVMIIFATTEVLKQYKPHHSSLKILCV